MQMVSGATPGGFRPPLLGERYVVCERLGRGGTAGVYLVFDLKLRSWYAAKVLHASCATDPELRSRFEREATTMARLAHDNVVRAIDIAAHVPVPYLIMENLAGGCVLDWVRRHGPMPPGLAMKCMIDVCNGLEAVHATGGVHRDVKPHNILVHRSGACKLTDFGIARLGPPRDQSRSEVPLDELHTEVGTVMGTAAFMAPEQRIDASSVDARADVYSAGASLYTLLTAKAAPDLCMVESDDPRFEGVPDLVVEVLLKACAYAPSDRYQDARRMADALGFVSRNVPIPPDLPPLAGTPRDLPPRPPHRLTSDQARQLGDLLMEGAVQKLYDPHEARTAPALAERSIAAPQVLDLDGRDEDSTLTTMDKRPAAALESPPPPLPPQAPPGQRDDLRSRAQEAGRFVPDRRAFNWIPLVVITGVLVLSLSIGATFAALIAARGARQIGEAQRVGLETSQRYYSVLHHNQPIIGDLARHGAHRDTLERAWFRFEDSPLADKGHAAADYYTVLELEYQSTRTRFGKDNAMHSATAAFQDISEARESHNAAMGAWQSASRTGPGRFAVSLGLASAPTLPP